MGQKPTGAFVLGLVAGIFFLLNAIALYVLGAFMAALLGAMVGGPTAAMDMMNALIGLMFAATFAVFGGSVLLLVKPEQHKLWGILVLVFSLVAIVGGGGFFLGTILGLIGGILALVWKGTPGHMAA